MASTYAELVRLPGIRAPLIASAIGRLPIGMLPLALILLVHAETGSFASAGVVDGCFALGAAAGLPTLGRFVDRRGQTPVLVPAVLVSAAALVGLAVAANVNAGVGGMAAFAVVAGAAAPPISACMRALWAARVDDEATLQSAYALEAVLVEVAFIGGPLLAAGVSTAISPTAAVLGAGVAWLVGTFAFAATAESRAWRGADRARDWAGALRSRGILVVAAGAGFFGFGQGVLELSLPAFGAEHGSPAIAGPMIAIQAVASLVGGAWYGARRWEAPAGDRWARLSALLAVGFAPLAFAGSVGVLAVLMVLPGLALAPVTSVAYLLAERASPPGTTTEAFGWLITATVIGAAAGSALGGAIVNSNVQAGFLVAFGGVCLSAVAAGLGRRTFRRPAIGTL